MRHRQVDIPSEPQGMIQRDRASRQRRNQGHHAKRDGLRSSAPAADSLIHGRKRPLNSQGVYMHNSHKTLVALSATFLMVLAIASPAALAQSSRDGYIQEGPSALDRAGGNGDGENPASDGSASEELPFTGLDLGLIAAAGASFMLLGVGMRRLTRASDGG